MFMRIDNQERQPTQAELRLRYGRLPVVHLGSREVSSLSELDREFGSMSEVRIEIWENQNQRGKDLAEIQRVCEASGHTFSLVVNRDRPHTITLMPMPLLRVAYFER